MFWGRIERCARLVEEPKPNASICAHGRQHRRPLPSTPIARQPASEIKRCVRRTPWASASVPRSAPESSCASFSTPRALVASNTRPVASFARRCRSTHISNCGLARHVPSPSASFSSRRREADVRVAIVLGDAAGGEGAPRAMLGRTDPRTAVVSGVMEDGRARGGTYKKEEVGARPLWRA